MAINYSASKFVLHCLNKNKQSEKGLSENSSFSNILFIFLRSGFSGKQCECDIGVSTIGEQTKKCMQNPDSGEICNNNGDCECGKCKCDSDHVGKFCACDKDECPR